MVSDQKAVPSSRRRTSATAAREVGETLDRAFWRLEELENLSRTYLLSRIGGTPAILGKAEMDEVMVSFSSYGPGAQD